jgi:hypothetical protein
MDQIDWKTLTHKQFLSFIPDGSSAFQFCLQIGIVDRQAICECGELMNLQVNHQKKVGMHFVCSSPRSRCQRKKSALTNSFFYQARIDIPTALECIAAYASNLSTEQLGFYSGVVSRSTLTNWRNHFRGICSTVIENQGEHKIGGLRMTVEIDESQVF